MKAMNRQRRPLRERGQAMVELAVCVTVFVTILIFAIHFAEVGFLSVKVTEAAHSAIFDATAHKLHEWPGNTDPADSAVRRAGNDAKSRYRDFDSRTTSSMNPTGVFTRGSNMNVECKLGEGPGYTRDPFNMMSFKDNGGINCQATASIDDYGAMRIPQRFMDQGGGRWFGKQHYVPRRISVCAMGRGSGGNCGAKLAMALDDWGLAGPQESKQCRLNVDSPFGSCDNEAFFKSARYTYLASWTYGGHTFAATQFAMKIVKAVPPPVLPGTESAFFMSDRGEPGGYTQNLTSEGERRFSTTPGGTGTENYKTARDKRENCFLGMKCPTR